MTNNQITFNDLPQVVAELRDEVSGMKALLLNLQNRPTQQRENRHRPVTPEQVAEYTNIPLATIYQKLANREIPGSKPGKRWVIYLDEIDKWLEANRKNPIPLTDEEQNAAILFFGLVCGWHVCQESVRNKKEFRRHCNRHRGSSTSKGIHY